jgi:aspartate/methionine/tyrosine aminotransferase
MAWAKLHENARYDLSTSGMIDYPLAELPVKITDLEIGGTGPYGYAPLMERLAAKAGVAQERLVYTFGTSMANFLALNALVHRGDEVLVEKPTYDPLLAILDHVGAQVTRFERRPEKGFRLGLGELERRITKQTRLVVLCNLHNPSSVFTDEDTMREVGRMAAAAGAHVLVDEVYLETLFDQPWKSAFHLGPNFVITSSLTKAYGLSGIRCGWILAQAVAGGTHVADRGLYLWQSRPSGRATGCDCTRQSWPYPRSRAFSAGNESSDGERFPAAAS